MMTPDNATSAPNALPESSAASSQAATNEGVARATGVLALGNVMSRVLGLARVIVMTNLFGADRAVDALTIALSVPKALYDLLIGGHVNSAIIPVLSEVVTLQGREALWRLVSLLCSVVAVLMSGLVLALTALAPQVMGLISASDPATLALATPLLRLTMPALLFMSLFAVLSGTLYALGRFTLPALAGVVFNGSIVLVTLMFAPPLQVMPLLTPDGARFVIQRPLDGIMIVSVGWLVGALAQLVLLMPGLGGARLRFVLVWRHPALRRMALLYAPVMFSLVIDTLINRLFSYRLAIQSGEGGAGYMDYATTLIQFPQGLVATAISIAILPTLSRQAALVSASPPDGDEAATHARAFKDTLGLGLRLATTLIVPAAMGLFVLATPVIVLLFEHGRFTTMDTLMTATALRLYLIGLPFAAIDLLLVYAFYARQDTMTPALIGVLSLAVYMVTAITLQPQYGLFSLMIADSLKHITHALVSAYLLHRRVGGLGGQRVLHTLGKTLAAALVMSLVAAQTVTLAAVWVRALPRLIGEVVVVAVGLGVGAAVFLLLAALLNIAELRWLMGLVARRLRGSAG